MSPARQAGETAAPGSTGEVVELIRSGVAGSRAAIAKATGLAASTVSLRVDQLLAAGIVREIGDEESRGGRRAKRVVIDPGAGVVVGVALGHTRYRLTITDLAESVLATAMQETRLLTGPRHFAANIWLEVTNLLVERGLGQVDVQAIVISVPAPVTYPGGRIASPGFMTDWHDADLPKLLASHTSVPVLVENDANLIALGEHLRRDRRTGRSLVAVKLGSRLGSGIVIDGRLHRGASGAAGEIGHPVVGGRSKIPCSCGIPDCIDSVASGRALVADFAARGRGFTRTDELVDASRRQDVEVIEALREAGVRIGTALAALVTFVDPSEVCIGGTLSESPHLVSALRAELLRRCPPTTTESLLIRPVPNQEDAETRGAIRLALEEALAPARVEAMIRDRGVGGTSPTSA